ncbi:hypothetical protein [Nocardia sp. NBC_00416]|uniref:hypothetical protein n=1 Tax=Nocardia sp. NBC_00416 TaxID=2975991 RepID=UPI002E1E289A
MTETSGPTLRPSLLDRLIQLDKDKELSVEHVRSASRKLGLTERDLQQWLTDHRTPSPPVAPAAAAAEPGTRRMGYREAGRRPRSARVSMTAGDDVLSRIPDSDVATFRADACRGLPRKEFARLDAVYAKGMAATCRWLTGHSGRPCRHDLDGGVPPNPHGLDEAIQAENIREILRLQPTVPRRVPAGPETGPIDDRQEVLGLYRFLGGLVSDSPGRGHTIVRLRGAQAAFLLHGMRLDLPSDLNYSVGPGLTTVRLDERTVELIRSRTTTPVDAAALATVLFTGATTVELGTVPCAALTSDSLVFTGPIGHGRAADMYVWVIPRSVRPLLHDACRYQQARASHAPKLFAGAIGGGGRHLQNTAARCAVKIPELHHWYHSWIRRTGLLRNVEQAEHARNTDMLFGLRLVPRPSSSRGRTGSA